MDIFKIEKLKLGSSTSYYFWYKYKILISFSSNHSSNTMFRTKSINFGLLGKNALFIIHSPNKDYKKYMRNPFKRMSLKFF